MARRKKSEYITRRVVDGRRYEVYTKKDGNLSLVTEVVLTGRINEETREQLKKDNEIDNIVLVEKEQLKRVYGVPVDKFMEIAIDITDLEENK